MKLLILTQSIDINNPILGFFHRWVEEFAKHFEEIVVICLEKGNYDLPKNVKVLSLGKELGKSKIKYVFNFYKYIWNERKNYDAVFVHMNPIYIILGWMILSIFKKRIGLWYVHKNVDLKLRLATLLTDYIFSASRESFRLKSKKVNIVGHGIDTQRFKPIRHTHAKKLVTVGRISRTKCITSIIPVLKILHNIDSDYTLTVVGDWVTPEDRVYKSELLNQVHEFGLNDAVFFMGSKNNNELAGILPNFDVFINLSDTGSVDKAVLEAASSGLKIVTSNIAFKDIFREGFVDSSNPEESAKKIVELGNKEWDVRSIVEDRFNIINLISKIKYIYMK